MQRRRFKEGRIFERFGFSAPVRFKNPKGSILGDGFCEDISGGGIRLRSKKKISPKSEVELKIDVPQTDASFSIRAVTIWAKQESKDQFIVGLAFKGADLMGLWLVFKKIFYKWIKEDRVVIF